MSDFQGVKVLITGAASGFGFACAKALADAGAQVAICDVNENQLRQAEQSLKGNVLAIPMDVSSSSSVRQGFEKCISTFGGLDALVNCAGIIKVTPLAEITESEWDRVLAVNLKGAFLCSQAAAPALCKSKRGRIVNIASDAAKIGFPLRPLPTSLPRPAAGRTRKSPCRRAVILRRNRQHDLPRRCTRYRHGPAIAQVENPGFGSVRAAGAAARSRQPDRAKL